MLGFFLSLIATLLHAALVFGAAPLLTGLLDHCRALLLGRRGPPVLQPYFYLWKLLRKLPAVPETATEFYAAWPYLAFAAIAAASLLVPSFATGMLTAPASDIVALIGLIALARLASILAGLETGFGFGGAGAAREAWLGIFAEAGLLVIALTFVLAVHDPHIDAMIRNPRSGGSLSVPLGLACVALLAAGIADIGDESRPAAELGLGRQATRLEYSGRFLLLFEYAEMLRLMLWLNLIGALAFPFLIGNAAHSLSWPAGLIMWVVKLLVLAVALALLQTAAARRRAFPASILPRLAILLGAVAAVLLLSFGGGV